MTTPELQERFQTVVDQHKKILYKVCNSYCRNRDYREDLAQEIIIQLWRSFDKFDERYRFSTWMYRIALNVAISFYRRENRRTRYVIAGEEHLLEAIDETTNQPEEILLLYEFIEGLDPLNKALVLLYLDGNNYHVVAWRVLERFLRRQMDAVSGRAIKGTVRLVVRDLRPGVREDALPVVDSLKCGPLFALEGRHTVDLFGVEDRVAADDQEFEADVRDLLARLHVSHTALYRSLPDKFPPQHTISATLRKLGNNGSAKWIFLDVFDNGPAHVAGIRPGDVLEHLDDSEVASSSLPGSKVAA